MSKLTRRLAQLPYPHGAEAVAEGRGGASESPARGSSSARAQTAGAALSEEAAGVPASAGGRAVLERKRARLSALQGALDSMVRRAGIQVQRRPPPAPAELPFVRRDGCPQRVQERSLDERIGRVSLGLVRRADRSLLSQLGLTPQLAGLDFERALYLDTETTGLGGGTGNVAFLVGLAFARGQGYVLEQLFLEEPDDEPALLAQVSARIEAASMVISFNGKSFDMPLLRARYVMNGLTPPPERPHLDLLHLVRRVHKGRGYRKTLAVLEREVLGFIRGDDVGGEEVALRYLHYLRTGDGSGLHDVVTHNEHDVWSLVALTGLYGEPLERIERDDLPWMARAVRRAGDLDRAGALATLAVERGAGTEGLRARGEIAKAAGDKALSLQMFEAVEARGGDAFVRLELAKLYEHHLRDPTGALAWVDRGVAESPQAVARRRARLERKAARRRRR